MSRRDTAEQQLERILYILPAAARAGGAALAELARALDVPPDTVLADIERLTAREFYHPAGSVFDFSISLSGDRVHVLAPSEFRRPVRLNAREMLALSLGLRVLASEADDARSAEIVRLAERLEQALSAPPEDELVASRVALAEATPPSLPRRAGTDEAELEYDREVEAKLHLDFGSDDARGVLAEAIAAHRACTITYLRPGDSAPSRRPIEPLLLVHHEGHWYIIAHDRGRDARRVFRLDRVLDVAVEQESFTPPADFDAAEFFAAGVGPLLAERDDEVTVRYSPRIARWIAERTRAPLEADGSVVVRHRVVDKRWIVRHVLQYGGEAELVGPEEYRQRVAESAERLGG